MECEAITQAFWEFVQWGFVYGSYKTAKVTLEELRKKREKFFFRTSKEKLHIYFALSSLLLSLVHYYF
jgi:hypothetical protein